MVIYARRRRLSLVILVVPDFLDDAGEISEVDLLFEGLIGSFGGDDDVVDHIADLHGKFRGLVDVRGVGRVGLGALAPFVPLLVPFGLVLHYI